MPTPWDGIYVAHMNAEGRGFAMFLFLNNRIIGADPFGGRFDGIYDVREDGAFVGQVTIMIPPGATVIQGIAAGPDGMTLQMPVTLEASALVIDGVSIETPLGLVMLKLQKLRGIETS